MVDADRQVAQPLGERERERALPGELAGRLERTVEDRVGDCVDEADPQRLLGVDRAAGVDDLLRRPEPADPREPLRPAPARDDPG